MGNLDLCDAARLACQRWAKLTESTRLGYCRTLTRFVAFAAAQGVHSLGDLDPAVCRRFVVAPLGGSRAGEAPSLQASRLRWGVVVGFVRALPVEQVPRSLLGMSGPSFAAAAARRLEPLSPPEVDLVRSVVGSPGGHTLWPVMVEAALAGASAGENAGLTVGDFIGSALRLPGSTGIRARVAPLDEHGMRVVGARVARVSSDRQVAWGCDPLLRPLALPRPGERYRPSSLAPVVSSSLLAAMDVAGVRRSGVRSRSLLAFAANRVYARTGRIESVAELLGRASLDSAAQMVDAGWQERWGHVFEHVAGDPGPVRHV